MRVTFQMVSYIFGYTTRPISGLPSRKSYWLGLRLPISFFLAPSRGYFWKYPVQFHGGTHHIAGNACWWFKKTKQATATNKQKQQKFLIKHLRHISPSIRVLVFFTVYFFEIYTVHKPMWRQMQRHIQFTGQKWAHKNYCSGNSRFLNINQLSLCSFAHKSINVVWALTGPF